MQSGDPGRVTLHRLNRAEYNATVRDLLAVDIRPADDFPPDDFGHGFDNIADVLSLSPLHLEMYEIAADRLIAEALADRTVMPVLTHIEAESPEVTATTGGASGSGWNLWSNGSLDAPVTLAHGGRYRLSVRAYGAQAGAEPVKMALLVDAAQVAVVDVTVTANAPAVYQAEVNITAGGHAIGAAFLNDYYDSTNNLDRNLIVDWLELQGPFDAPAGPPPGRGRYFTCDPASTGEEPCARQILAGFGKRAWRRPVTEAELDRLMAVYTLSRQSGGTWDEGVLLGIKAILVSHHFVFRVERDPAPEDTGPRQLDAWELASRISYFLWSSMPDDELFAAAEDGSLLEPEVIEAQVRRMLADPKAVALIDNLAGQWLYIRAVDNAAPDYQAFPAWDDDLRASMKGELERMVSDVLLGDRSMLDLITTAETWVDARLAQHYGLTPPPPGEWQAVSLAGTQRAGILTTGGLLTALSYPARTSPVRRGKWVLENLTCEQPAPPPPGVEGLPADSGTGGLSLREQMEQHRANPVCASCHTTMDPIGFGLERFDGIGAYRDVDASGFAIDSSGVLPGGIRFDGAVELAETLAADPKVPWCMVQKVFTYALGRAPTVYDLSYLDEIEARFIASDHRFADLAVAIAQSVPFRYRRGEEAPSRTGAAR